MKGAAMADEKQEGRFALDEFFPYMLNQAAEAVSLAFQEHYRREYGLTRTQWRIIAHLDAEPDLNAKQICARSHEDKVSVSRAVAALEQRGFLTRAPSVADRRFEVLRLAPAGQQVFAELAGRARMFEQELSSRVGEATMQQMRTALQEFLTKLEGITRSR